MQKKPRKPTSWFKFYGPGSSIRLTADNYDKTFDVQSVSKGYMIDFPGVKDAKSIRKWLDKFIAWAEWRDNAEKT